MKLNQNILSPYNNFNKIDITSIEVAFPDKLETHAQPVTEADQTKLYLAEYLLDYYLRNSSMPAGDNTDNKLRYLDCKIEATRKTVSSWESYRISAVATGEEELRQKLGALQPNTGLVVNSLESASVTVNNQSYARGDIIFKDINNQQHHIPSYSGGYYYPSAIDPVMKENDNSVAKDGTETASNALDADTSTFTGSYILSYTYATSAPTSLAAENPIPTLSKDTLSTPSEKIQVNFTPVTESGSYGYRGTVSKGNSLQEDMTVISTMQPVVAWYITTDSGKGERVYFDVEYSINDENEIECTNTTSFTSLWVEVR